MKLFKAKTLLALCAALFLVLPSVVNAAIVIPDGTTTKDSIPTTAHPTSPIETRLPTTTLAPVQTTNPQPPPQTRTTKQVITSVSTVGTVPASLPTSLVPTASTTGVVPPASNNGTCSNSSTCPTGGICGLTSANSTTGSCFYNIANVCESSPIMTCTSSSDCPTAFSYCTSSKGQMVCTGLGIPGTSSECKAPESNSLMSTVKYAGIAVGSVAALGLAFAMVRWQRRRQRSKMPAEMFGEIDYGMTDRSAAAPVKPVENYPFSSRPNAHGNDHAPLPPSAHDYNEQYYEEPVGYNGNMHSNKMQQDQYYGHDQYDNNQYGGGGGYGHGGGYDQHSAHGGGGGGHGGDGFYDNAGYEDYQQHQHHPASPAAVARAVSPRHQNFNQVDNYGAEPSELDFGGHGHGHGGGAGHGGYGGGRY